MPRNRCRCYSSQIAVTTASVFWRIAIQELSPEARHRHPDPVVAVSDRSEVTGNQYRVTAGAPLANQADHAVLNIIAVNPLEACPLEVHLIEGWLAPIKPIQVADPSLEAGMRQVLEEVPFQALIV